MSNISPASLALRLKPLSSVARSFSKGQTDYLQVVCLFMTDANFRFGSKADLIVCKLL